MFANLTIKPYTLDARRRDKIRFSLNESYKSIHGKKDNMGVYNEFQNMTNPMRNDWMIRRDGYEGAFDPYIQNYRPGLNAQIDKANLIQALNKLVKKIGPSCISDWVLRQCLEDHHFTKSAIDDAIANLQESIRLKERSKKEVGSEYQGWTPKHNIYWDFFSGVYAPNTFTDEAKVKALIPYLQKFVERFGEKELTNFVLHKTLRDKNIRDNVIDAAIHEVRNRLRNSHKDMMDSWGYSMKSAGIDTRPADKILRDDLDKCLEDALKKTTGSWFDEDFKKSIEKADAAIKKSIGPKAVESLHKPSETYTEGVIECDDARKYAAYHWMNDGQLLYVPSEQQTYVWTNGRGLEKLERFVKATPEVKKEYERVKAMMEAIPPKCPITKEEAKKILEEPLIPERRNTGRRFFKAEHHAENLRKTKYGKCSERDPMNGKFGTDGEIGLFRRTIRSTWWKAIFWTCLGMFWGSFAWLIAKYGLNEGIRRMYNWN